LASQRLASVTLLVLSCVVFCLNVALVVQNRALKAEVAVPRALLPQIGTKIGKLDGVGLTGSRIELPFGGDNRKTLLFVFSTTCHFCDLNWPAWRKVSQSTGAGQY